MSKILCSVMFVATVAGCAWQERPPRQRGDVTVIVDNDGMRAEEFKLATDDLSAFADEVGDRAVVIRPVNTPDFAKLVQAKKALEEAGIKRVSIRGMSGG